MGVGTPQDIVEAVSVGVDMFDCVLPTRNARNGMLFTRNGKSHVKQADTGWIPGRRMRIVPVTPAGISRRAYLRHLFVSGEISSSILNTIHNLHFYLELMSDIRHSIREHRFHDLKIKVKEMYDD